MREKKGSFYEFLFSCTSWEMLVVWNTKCFGHKNNCRISRRWKKKNIRQYDDGITLKKRQEKSQQKWWRKKKRNHFFFIFIHHWHSKRSFFLFTAYTYNLHKLYSEASYARSMNLTADPSLLTRITRKLFTIASWLQEVFFFFIEFHRWILENKSIKLCWDE